MKATQLTGEGKEALRKAVRGLRERLLSALLTAAKSEYRLDVAADKAKLPEGRRERRERLDAWLEEQARGARGGSKGKSKGKGEDAASRERFLGQAVQEAAHTLLNRLIVVRILEHHGVIAPAVVTGGWKSPAYEQEFVHYAGPLGSDDTRGYAALLEVVFAELAVDLPGLFGVVGLTGLFPVPAAVLREVVEALNGAELESAWGDDTTLGWVYQYWNDPERERLDKKIAERGKIEPHEIASKTQMFTERYMVEWLLQNSLGVTWLGICKKNGWTADAEAVLPVLEARRAAWRVRREAGEVAADALMPVAEGLESAWKYYVPQALPGDAAEKAPGSIREVRLLDPACGSGHFLVIAFGLMVDLYREEARHRGVSWSDEEIAGWIVGGNLHGIDIDPRAIQIAAAGLMVRARLFAPGARIERMNLVAPALRLGDLPEDDKALVGLCGDLQREVGIPEEITRALVKGIAGVDYLGTLLRVDKAVREAVEKAAVRAKVEIERGKTGQGDLWRGYPMQQIELAAAQQTGMERLAEFLAAHSNSEDLGLRLQGEQLAAGVRFVEMVREGSYDVVVGNPPYQALTKAEQFGYVLSEYPRGKADLYAAFLDRGLELTREGGLSALLTMRGWMFLGQFKNLREHVLANFDIRAIGDFDRGAFDEVPNEVLAVAAPIIRRAPHAGAASVALQPTPFDDTSYDRQRTNRKRAAVLAQVGRHEFDPKGFGVIEGEPIVYWWTKEFLEKYAKAPKLGTRSPGRFGLTTGDNDRFVRLWHETQHETAPAAALGLASLRELSWVPFVLGGKGRVWFEPYRDVCRWTANGLEVKEKCVTQYGTVSKQIRNEDSYFRAGVAFAMIGSAFSGRAHRYPSVIGNMGSSVFPANVREVAAAVCLMNCSVARSVLQSLNPGVHFEVGDVNRLPIFPVADADQIFATLDRAFTEHETHREPSVEYLAPGPSPWAHAQTWAQQAVDRPEGAPLPPYEPTYDPAEPTAYVSHALGLALGRFPGPPRSFPDGSGASPDRLEGLRADKMALPDRLESTRSGNGALPAPEKSTRSGNRTSRARPGSSKLVREAPGPVREASFSAPEASNLAPEASNLAREASNLAPEASNLAREASNLAPEAFTALPHGILFLSAAASPDDGLAHPACAPLLAAWRRHGPAVSPGDDLRAYLRTRFFAWHRALYENRPIYFPLSSAKKSFVAWVSIHRFADDTLQVLLADHLHPALRALDGEMADLNQARASSDKKTAAAADKRYVAVKRLRDELADFLDAVAACAERGAPPTDPACPPRQVDAPFRMDLDDGVMINSAALWPLLDPQWTEPKKAWKHLARAEGRKDYDWAHLARRYFPERVAKKCADDPSLAVAHGCFWRLHPAKAYAWELRLQDEIRPDFTIDEPDSDASRAAFLRAHPAEARALEEAEQKRRERKAAKAGDAEDDASLQPDDGDAADDAEEP